MQILLALGGLSETKRLVPITSAHVSGASYKMIGDPGLEFLEDFARDARVAVPTTVNPLGTDLAQWKELGIPPDFAEKQARIARDGGRPEVVRCRIGLERELRHVPSGWGHSGSPPGFDEGPSVDDDHPTRPRRGEAIVHGRERGGRHCPRVPAAVGARSARDR